MSTITVDRFFDPHVHLREGDVVHDLIKYSVEGGVDVIGAMPNTLEGLTTADQVEEYIRNARRLSPPKSVGDVSFIPYLQLTETTDPAEIERCVQRGIKNAKLYPKGRTTNSHRGIRDYYKMLPLVRICGELGMMCHVHPEYPWMDITQSDAEYQFLPIADMFLRDTSVRLVWEHGTEHRCIPNWESLAKEYEGRFAVTLTGHHLAFSEEEAHGDVSLVCMPKIKTRIDRHALVRLVERDYDWVMLGSDTAFHPHEGKHPDKGGCACGSFVSPFLPELYAHALDEMLCRKGGVEVFERFTSKNGREWHGHGPASGTLALERVPSRIALTYDVGGQIAVPAKGGFELLWSRVR